MKELIEQLEKCSGPDRAIDAAIHWTVNRAQAETVYWNAACGLPKNLPADFIPSGLGAMAVMLASPAFTRSIDAALTLVPQGWTWSLTHAFAIDAYLTFHKEGSLRGVENEVEVHDAQSAPLALCIASLKARMKTLAATPEHVS